MPRMIPPTPRTGANVSERKAFQALEGMPDRDDWVVIHSLRVARHRTAYVGEADFIVLAPGKGMIIIEAKAPREATYRDGVWNLPGTPTPDKDPLEQLAGVQRSVRGYLKAKDALTGNEPISKLVWFTSIGRHQFASDTASGSSAGSDSPGDLQFFEWELAWKDDLAKPARMLDHVFSEHDRWFSGIEQVEHEPTAFDQDRLDTIMHTLLGNFHVSESVQDRRVERQAAEAALLAEQEVVLELTANNPRVYLEGPAGTGKSHLIAKAARRANRVGERTLVTCWNLLMAHELEAQVGGLSNVEVADVNTVMLRLVGLDANPVEASHDWFTRELPELAVKALTEKPHLGDFQTLLVDEFQDVAGSPDVLRMLTLLTGAGERDSTRVLLAGDSRQQIMRTNDEKVDAFAVAKGWIPDLVHVAMRRNCRNVQAITEGAERLLSGVELGFTSHRLPAGVPGGFQVRDASGGDGAETNALSTALRELLQEYSPDHIIVLSPFGAKRSVVGRFLERPEKSRAERWLRKCLEKPDSEGGIRWRSVFKFKGLEADAVVLTDIGETAKQFTSDNGLSFTDLLYVAITRAKYRCIVLTGD